jgi:uncharacterized protein YcgI (DUF1989 family)
MSEEALSIPSNALATRMQTLYSERTYARWAHLLRTGIGADVALRCQDDDEMRAHRLILINCSPVITACLCGGTFEVRCHFLFPISLLV